MCFDGFCDRFFFFVNDFVFQVVDGFFTGLDSDHLRAVDRDGDVISYVIIQKPTHGSIVKIADDSKYENIEEFTQEDIDNEIVGYLQTNRERFTNDTSKLFQNCT